MKINNMWKKIKKLINLFKNILIDLFFPITCLNCQKEKEYLCLDCQALIDSSGFHQKFSTENLFDLYFAADYKNKLIKKLINLFKNYPYVQQLAQPLALLIINHFQLIDNKPDFSGFILIAMPVSRKELKKRGFNQAELLAKNLSLFLEIPLLTNCLIKLDQTKNLNQSFEIKNINLIKDKNILLVDDYYQTGQTMEKAGQALKKAKANKVIGLVVVRG